MLSILDAITVANAISLHLRHLVGSIEVRPSELSPMTPYYLVRSLEIGTPHSLLTNINSHALPNAGRNNKTNANPKKQENKKPNVQAT
jgi:hypothetical protein